MYSFGAASSSSCANFALRRTVSDHEQEYGAETVAKARSGFYVDDCLTSTSSVETATNLVHELHSLLIKGGFCLTKWISNSREVMNLIPKSEWSEGVSDLDLSSDDLPLERALGLHWNVKKNSLTFKIKSRGKPSTRRGILSVINSIYDPLGFGVVAVLPMKFFCKNLDCDDPVPAAEERRWLS